MNFGSHKSWESYVDSLNTPLRFDAKASGAERDYAFSVLRKANLYFYQQHIAKLPQDMREQIKRGMYASQSHKKREQAHPILDRFAEYLRQKCRLPITDQPTIGFYHFDEIIFRVEFDSEKPWSEIDDEIPPFFEGFRVLRFRQSERFTPRSVRELLEHFELTESVNKPEDRERKGS